MLRILVVDDEPLLLQLLCGMLDDLGCEAVCVDCPLKGIEKIETDSRIAMLITDIQMPAMDGFELADRARAKRPDLPIVLISGNDPGRTGYPVFKKPFSELQLAEIIAPLTRVNS